MNLSKNIFWDVDYKEIDFEKNARFVIHRVITRGIMEDWLSIKRHYGLEFIKKEILQMRHLDPKTLNFFSTIFKIDKSKFRCYTMQQSIPKHWNY